MDAATQRRNMVDGQLRPNRVTDPRLLQAMLDLPREAFLPEALAPRAMLDANLPLVPGRVQLAPLTEAWLIEAAALDGTGRVLVLPALGGYLAALASRVAAAVVAVESDPTLLALAWRALAQHAPGVRLEERALAGGSTTLAPYDAILVEGMIETAPDTLIGLLAEGGVLVTVRPREGAPPGAVPVGQVAVGIKAGGTLVFRPRSDAMAPVLPEFARVPVFEF